MVEGFASVLVSIQRVTFNALAVKSTLDIDTVLRTTARWITLVDIFASVTIRGEFFAVGTCTQCSKRCLGTIIRAETEVMRGRALV